MKMNRSSLDGKIIAIWTEDKCLRQRRVYLKREVLESRLEDICEQSLNIRSKRDHGDNWGQAQRQTESSNKITPRLRKGNKCQPLLGICTREG